MVQNGLAVAGRLTVVDFEHVRHYLADNYSLRHSISGLYSQDKLQYDLKAFQSSNKTTFTVAHIKVDDLTNRVRQFGTELLLNVARQLQAASDILHEFNGKLYHLDTDTFMVIIEGHIEIKFIRNLFDNFLMHYTKLDDRRNNPYADKLSIGIVPNLDASTSIRDILDISTQTRRYAYSLKNSCIAIFTKETRPKVERYSYIEKRLSNAIKHHQLYVKFHPIIDSRKNRIESFEALVRWKSARYGEIGSVEFIHVAERQGFIYDLGLHVFQRACRFLNQYNQKHEANVKININVSVLQLINRDLPSVFRRIALTHGIKPSSIVLELTETVTLDDDSNALKQIKILSGMGFILSLDDFGAGMTSLNSFFDFPFRQIKIDRFFALRALSDSLPTQFLHFLIQLCKARRISIVVEGIENKDMSNHYIAMGATHLQGYHFATPLEETRALNFVLNHEHSPPDTLTT